MLRRTDFAKKELRTKGTKERRNKETKNKGTKEQRNKRKSSYINMRRFSEQSAKQKQGENFDYLKLFYNSKENRIINYCNTMINGF